MIVTVPIFVTCFLKTEEKLSNLKIL